MSWRDALLFTLALSGFLIPLLWALRELYFPRDDAPLGVDSGYSKDDRFFAHTFDRLLDEQLGPPPRVSGTAMLRVDEKEYTVLTTNGDYRLDRDGSDRILDVQGSFQLPEKTMLRQGAHVVGDVELGSSSRLPMLASKSTTTLAREVAIDSWIDSEERLEAGDGCHLGFRATSGSAIRLGRGVSFGLLSAPKIEIGPPMPPQEAPSPTPQTLARVAPPDVPLTALSETTTIARGSLLVPDGVQVKGNVIVRGSAVLGSGAVVDGSMYADGAILVRRGARVTGSLLAGGAIRIDDACRIGEHLISGGPLRVGKGVTVGTSGRVTTVLGYEDIELQQGVRVFGRILARHGGRTA